jgi:hypothetical protein
MEAKDPRKQAPARVSRRGPVPDGDTLQGALRISGITEFSPRSRARFPPLATAGARPFRVEISSAPLELVRGRRDDFGGLWLAEPFFHRGSGFVPRRQEEQHELPHPIRATAARPIRTRREGLQRAVRRQRVLAPRDEELQQLAPRPVHGVATIALLSNQVPLRGH